jgi:hypothetical protein
MNTDRAGPFFHACYHLPDGLPDQKRNVDVLLRLFAHASICLCPESARQACTRS